MEKTSKLNRTMFVAVIWLLILSVGQGQVASSADFLYQSTYTQAILWNNLVGIVFNYPEIEPYLSDQTFKGYMSNSNIKGAWNSNWAPVIRMPKGYHFNCSMMAINTSIPNCIQEFQQNATFFSLLGEYVWDTTLQPFWTYGINNQYIDWFEYDTLSTMNQYFYQIYLGSGNMYHLEAIHHADKMVQNQLRQGNYTVQDLLLQAWQWQQAVYGLSYRGPGSSQDSSSQWLTCIDRFFQQAWISIFTAEAVIFEDQSLATIENLMSDNYTKDYLTRRFTVDDQLLFASFSNYPFSFSEIRFVNGNGVDGVTNTLAAAIWFIDFTLQCTMYQMYDIHQDGSMYSGNYQGVMGPGPDFQPQALYYGMIFTSLMLTNGPGIVLPVISGGTSSKIKIWGLQSSLQFNVVILNKDTNPNLRSSVSITIKSSQAEKMSCIYLQAPSLDSKADQITIGGHQYQSGNSTVIGNFQRKLIPFNPDSNTYDVPLNYAQVAYCTIVNPNIVIPRVQECQASQIFNVINYWILSLLTLTIFLAI